MKIIKYLIFNFFLIVVFSCSSKRDLYYLQDMSTVDAYSINYNKYKIKSDDILKIDVGSEIPETSIIFNPRGINPNTSNGKESLLYSGYQVGLDGFINFPSLGKIKASGKTIDEIRDYIYQLIIDKGLLVNPSVDVKILNSHFTILGEVNKPGRYGYLSNNINILEAIGMAGDLTINGLRKEIKLIREISGVKTVANIDLTDSSIFKNNSFQIISGDIIIVNPNSSRVKNAGIIGNSGTLLSLLSFILSSIIVISSN